MKRSSSITLIFTAHLAMLGMFMAAPASVMGQTITITTIEQLQEIGNNASYPLNGYYVLGGDIDASQTRTWNSGTGFEPIGTSSSAFSGSLDGQGFAIRNLFINRGDADYVGLFGYVSGELATIAHLALDNATVTGRNYTGTLMGYNYNCTIKQCSTTGSVRANSYVGGLVGRSQALSPISISNCYSTSTVSGNGGVGGLVGYNVNTPISTCFSAGRVTGGESWTGGLIGYNTNATISNCFWDISTSGQSSSAGGTGKTTADMKKRATFTAAGWDFTTVWGIFDGSSYPFLRGANDLPQAEPDSYTVGINSVFTAAAPGVLKNDSDADGDLLTARLVTGPSNGKLSFKSTGSFTYTPDEDFNETDSFTYKALAGGDNTTAVTVTLIMGNTAPVAVSDTYPTSRNLPLNVPAPGVLANDTDPSSDDTLTALLVTGPFHGELTLRENGSFSYKPEKAFYGTDNITSDNFTYIASDGELDSPPATVIINFTPLCSLESLFPDNVTELMPLRRYRDEVLATSASGRAFIKFYYRMSPLAEKIFGNSELLRRTARKIVTSSLPWVQERLSANEEF